MAKKTNGWQIATFVLIGVLVLGLITGFIVLGNSNRNEECSSNIDCQKLDYPSVCVEGKCYPTGEIYQGGTSPQEKCQITGGDWANNHCICESNNHLIEEGYCIVNDCVYNNNCEYLCSSTGGDWANGKCVCYFPFEFSNKYGCILDPR